MGYRQSEDQQKNLFEFLNWCHDGGFLLFSFYFTIEKLECKREKRDCSQVNALLSGGES